MKKVLKLFLPWIQVDKKMIKKHEISYKLLKYKCKNLSKINDYLLYRKYHCIISASSNIAKNIIFPHPLGIVIGEGVTIGENTIIYQNVTIGRKNRDLAEYPKIGKNVIIYANSVIVGNIVIGDNSIVGCNSVVLRDVNEGETVFGIVK